ncbi:beta-ketoacyl-ACP synthase 3 [Streptomyces sp. TRM 70351]|uniref:beta-ketoacyl-ACP synthase 3 n=1 Tax=Streptomyces sp. TRM 70351 TaxID=3116552 RepID=UPI002E7BD89D|nr:beta-ketoacyl-ACP synthase 3 [Streptomyces sp. TRM 70351]MEE1928861.1 beta-ketoacyl-ACP synthase 3 [Streptomyces sp. TRM 70351]
MTLRTRRPHAGARIAAVGAYRPSLEVGNDEIGARLGVSPQWIQRRSGITTRRFAGEHESVIAMAVEAGRKALAQCGTDPADLSLVILATTSFTEQVPAAAPRIARRLGASTAGAVDLNAACAGFGYALAQADALVRSGEAHSILIIGSERMSDLVDPCDPDTAFLFADGAGAAVVAASNAPGIGPVVWGAEGDRHQLVTCGPQPPNRAPDASRPALRMAGLELYRWATTHLPDIARQAVEAAGLRLEDIAAFIPHQANARIIDTLASALALRPDTVVARDISEAGNTSAASVPLAMDDLLTRNAVASGDRALLLGFGAGLAYAAQVVTLP